MKLNEIAKSCSGVLQDSKKIQIYHALNPPKEEFDTVGIEYSLGGHTIMSGIRFDILYSRDENPVIAEVKSGKNYKGRDVEDQLKNYKHELNRFLSAFGMEKQAKLIAILPENDKSLGNSYIASDPDIQLFTYDKREIIEEFKEGYNTPQDIMNIIEDRREPSVNVRSQSFKTAKKDSRY